MLPRRINTAQGISRHPDQHGELGSPLLAKRPCTGMRSGRIDRRDERQRRDISLGRRCFTCVMNGTRERHSQRGLARIVHQSGAQLPGEHRIAGDAQHQSTTMRHVGNAPSDHRPPLRMSRMVPEDDPRSDIAGAVQRRPESVSHALVGHQPGGGPALRRHGPGYSSAA